MDVAHTTSDWPLKVIVCEHFGIIKTICRMSILYNYLQCQIQNLVAKKSKTELTMLSFLETSVEAFRAVFLGLQLQTEQALLYGLLNPE